MSVIEEGPEPALVSIDGENQMPLTWAQLSGVPIGPPVAQTIPSSGAPDTSAPNSAPAAGQTPEVYPQLVVEELRRDLPRANRPALRLETRFKLLASWEGVVLDAEIKDGTFLARVTDSATGEASEAEILVDEVADEDAPLLTTGAVFYWTIGYRIAPGGRERVSRIKFRRLPAWSPRDIERTSQRAAELAERISRTAGSTRS